jgi:hypothetical protein
MPIPVICCFRILTHQRIEKQLDFTPRALALKLGLIACPPRITFFFKTASAPTRPRNPIRETKNEWANIGGWTQSHSFCQSLKSICFGNRVEPAIPIVLKLADTRGEIVENPCPCETRHILPLASVTEANYARDLSF